MTSRAGFVVASSPAPNAAGDAPGNRWCSIYRLGSALPLRFGFPTPVMVWLAEPDERHQVEVLPWLSATERARYASMQHPRARAEFLSGRWLLRGMLGLALGLHPAAVEIAETPDGALFCPVAGAPSFNLSHTPGLLAVALAQSGEVGVDVEWAERRGRTVELADRYFAPDEVARLLVLPPVAATLGGPSQRRRFFELWTLKEAWIKARGLGLRIPLHSFSFRFDTDPAVPVVSTSQMTSTACADTMSGNNVSRLTVCQNDETHKLTQRQRIAITTQPSAADDRTGWRFVQVQPMPHHHLGVAWLPAGSRSG